MIAFKEKHTLPQRFLVMAWLLLACMGYIRAFAQGDCRGDRFSVFFGERSSVTEKEADNTIRIFIDQDGSFYPEYEISDKMLLNNCGSIKHYLGRDSIAAKQICGLYGIGVTQGKNTLFTAINNAVVSATLKKINERVKNFDRVDVLIHGFRKRMYNNGDGSSSLEDNKLLTHKISSATNDRILFIEVYWDSKYRRRSLKDGGIRKGLRLFEKGAIPNALQAGLALRSIIPNIEHHSINLVTHSVGALVACELLFNTMGSNMAERHQPCPMQRDIRLCMIAPAIGSELFDNYYKRSNATSVKTDNYKLLVGYNEKDIVLNKTFKWHGLGVKELPTAYGNTSLGANYNNDVDKLLKKLTKSPKPVIVDFSESTRYSHHISSYIRNPRFKEVIAFFEQ